MDPTSKTLLISVLVILSYMASSLISAPFLGISGGEMMLNFSQPGPKVINLLLIAASLFLGGVVAHLIKPAKPSTEEAPFSQQQRFVPGLLTPDERRVVEEIHQSGEITQDSLRFRLEWSKAKVSAILTNLERMNVIQRERAGKTNNIFLSKAYNEAAYGAANGSERSDQQVRYPRPLFTLLARLRRRRLQ